MPEYLDIDRLSELRQMGFLCPLTIGNKRLHGDRLLPGLSVRGAPAPPGGTALRARFQLRFCTWDL